MRENLDYKRLKIAESGRYFLVDNMPYLQEKGFLEVLKFHSEGLAAVQTQTGWAHIHLNGDFLTPKKYSRTFGFYFERAAVWEDTKAYHLNTKGEPAYPHSYDWVGNFQENVSVVRQGNAYFHIDTKGQPLYPQTYLFVGDFKDGWACAKQEDGFYTHINQQGRSLYLNPRFLDLGIFHKRIATAKDAQGWYHINPLGESLYPARFLEAEPFYNGRARVRTLEGISQIITEKGEVVLIF